MRTTFINSCLTGMVPEKKDTPYIPIEPAEIVKSALLCANAGASIVHLHARGKDGKPTWDKNIYAEIISGIRNKNKDLIISVSTSGRNWSEFEKRSQVLELEGDLKPDLASLTCGSLNFMKDSSMNSPDMIERLALKMLEKNIKPELEVFEPGMIHKAKFLIDKKIITDPKPYFNIFLGSLGTSPLEPASFSAFHSLLPPHAVWAVGGIGRFQIDSNLLSMSLSGGVRVGLEDNIYFDRERKNFAKNESLVKRLKCIADLGQIKVLNPTETRELLNI